MYLFITNAPRQPPVFGRKPALKSSGCVRSTFCNRPEGTSSQRSWFLAGARPTAHRGSGSRRFSASLGGEQGLLGTCNTADGESILRLQVTMSTALAFPPPIAPFSGHQGSGDDGHLQLCAGPKAASQAVSTSARGPGGNTLSELAFCVHTDHCDRAIAHTQPLEPCPCSRPCPLDNVAMG